MKNQKLILGSSVLMLVIAFALGAYIFNQSKEQKTAAQAIENFELFVRPHSPSKGPDDAKVILVEFLDPECESCRRFHPFVKDLVAQYPNDIKYVLRYTPFHRNSKFAIAILESARQQGKFWETLDILFENQPKWGGHHNPQPELIWNYLPVVGVDTAKVREYKNNPEIKKIIDQDVADAVTLEVRQTPTFFINGKKLQNFGFQGLRDAVTGIINKK